jgi:hypothetical protein
MEYWRTLLRFKQFNEFTCRHGTTKKLEEKLSTYADTRCSRLKDCGLEEKMPYEKTLRSSKSGYSGEIWNPYPIPRERVFLQYPLSVWLCSPVFHGGQLLSRDPQWSELYNVGRQTRTMFRVRKFERMSTSEPQPLW